MEEKKYNKIVVVSLYEKFSTHVAKNISNDLGMLFCSARELLAYEIMDRKLVEEKCSVEYLKKQEQRVLRNLASYENVCVSISYERFMESYADFQKNSVIVFIDLPKTYIKQKSKISYIRYDERKARLEQNSTIIIRVRKVDAKLVKNKILKLLGGIL